jgi:hypothetical protein
MHIGVYHGIYYNISCSFISHSIHVSSTPPGPCAALFSSASSQLHRLTCSLARFGQTRPTPLLSLCHSDLASLPPPIAPNPEVDLIEPASVASPHARICSSSSPDAEAVGQGWTCVAADRPSHERHTSQHILSKQFLFLNHNCWHTLCPCVSHGSSVTGRLQERTQWSRQVSESLGQLLGLPWRPGTSYSPRALHLRPHGRERTFGRCCLRRGG